jgi:hypothetical protein
MGTWAPENWDSTMLNPSGDGRNFEATLQWLEHLGLWDCPASFSSLGGKPAESLWFHGVSWGFLSHGRPKWWAPYVAPGCSSPWGP